MTNTKTIPQKRDTLQEATDQLFEEKVEGILWYARNGYSFDRAVQNELWSDSGIGLAAPFKAKIADEAFRRLEANNV